MKPYYQDDFVTLYHADCLEHPELWTCADVLVTDPPYGRAWRQGELKGHVRNEASDDGILNDSTTQTRDEALTLWGKDRPAIVFGDLMLAPPAGTKLTAIYAKTTDSGIRGAIGKVRRDAESIYFWGKWQSGIGGRSSIFRVAAPSISGAHGVVSKAGGHPHAKALNVLEELIILTPPGAIADPFAGSGSTLVAAKALGRKAVGVELEEKYCEIAANRLAQEVLPLWDV